jgi:hypothetical protein
MLHFFYHSVFIKYPCVFKINSDQQNSIVFRNRSTVYNRFKIHFEAQDSTGSVSLTLWDTMAKIFFRKTASEMRLELIRVAQ